MAFQQIVPLEGESVRLRQLEETDLDLTFKWRNLNRVRKWFEHSEIITIEEHRKFYEDYCRRDNDVIFIIEEIGRIHHPIGQVSLYNIDWRERNAEYGRLMIGEEDALGLGLALEATKLILHAGFELMQLNRIYLDVFQNNRAAIAIYEKCGFKFVSDNGRMIRMEIKVTEMDQREKRTSSSA